MQGTGIALVSFPGSLTLEYEHDDCEDGESLVSLVTEAAFNGRESLVVHGVRGGGGRQARSARRRMKTQILNMLQT